MLKAHPFARSSFWLRVAVGVLLIALFDRLFLFHEIGSTLGAFALAWIVGLVLVRPGLARGPRALTLLTAAVGFALVLIDRPGPLAWLLFLLSLTLAVLSARVRAGEPAWRWVQRLVVHGVVSGFGPILDLMRLGRYGRRGRPGTSRWATVRMLILPLVGGAVFLALFASANPLIADMLDRLRLPPLSEETIGRVICWGLVGLLVGSTLRPRWRRKLIALPSLGGASMPGVTGASIVLSLIVFNTVFALQNGLDLAFLWSGAPLPPGVTLAEYAHRGAFPLIGTALLAGLFVLVALRPGSETARRPLVRRLVVVWVAQNMLLVASCMLRTADYIEAYALTRFRIAALIWMVVVGIGLGLICWRMLKDKDGHWLIDANVKLVLTVLAVVSVLDLGAITAAWNVRHGREAGGKGVELDLAYLRGLGSPALVSLVELERAAPDPEFRARVGWVRQEIMMEVRDRQSERRGWIWRDARRLDRVARLTADRPLPLITGKRDSDGRLIPPPPLPIVTAPPAPLTSRPGA